MPSSHGGFSMSRTIYGQLPASKTHASRHFLLEVTPGTVADGVLIFEQARTAVVPGNERDYSRFDIQDVSDDVTGIRTFLLEENDGSDKDTYQTDIMPAGCGPHRCTCKAGLVRRVVCRHVLACEQIAKATAKKSVAVKAG